MKKWAVFLIFALSFVFSQPVKAEYYEVQNTLKVFKAPSFNSPSVENIQPGYVWFEYNSPDGWIKLSNERWIAPKGAQITFDRRFEAFKTYLNSEKYVFNPQTVIATDGRENGLLLINTSVGPLWTGLYGMPLKMDVRFNAYNIPDSYTTPVAWFEPQTVNVTQTLDNGWTQIDTSLGKKWILRYPRTETINRNFVAYNDPNYSNHGYVFNPQSVNVISGNEKGWLQIMSSVGHLWVAPQGSYLYISTNFAAYDTPYGRVAATFAPQNVFVKEESVSPFGFLKISTSLGDKWIRVP